MPGLAGPATLPAVTRHCLDLLADAGFERVRRNAAARQAALPCLVTLEPEKFFDPAEPQHDWCVLLGAPGDRPTERPFRCIFLFNQATQQRNDYYATSHDAGLVALAEDFERFTLPFVQAATSTTALLQMLHERRFRVSPIAHENEEFARAKEAVDLLAYAPLAGAQDAELARAIIVETLRGTPPVQRRLRRYLTSVGLAVEGADAAAEPAVPTGRRVDDVHGALLPASDGGGDGGRQM